jgi:hypothetical protein
MGCCGVVVEGRLFVQTMVRIYIVCFSPLLFEGGTVVNRIGAFICTHGGRTSYSRQFDGLRNGLVVLELALSLRRLPVGFEERLLTIDDTKNIENDVAVDLRQGSDIDTRS